MFRTPFGLFCIVCVAAVACNKDAPDRAAVDRARGIGEQYDSLATAMIQSVQYVGHPLRSLTEEQQASVAALLVMTNAIARSGRFLGDRGNDLTGGFWTEVGGICPPMPERPEFSRGECWAEEVAWALAMASCKDEDDEAAAAECRDMAADEEAAVIMCHFRQLQDLEGVIGRIPGGTWPPGPWPWPDVEGGRVPR